MWSRVVVESKEDYKLPLRTRTRYNWEPFDLDYYRAQPVQEDETEKDYTALREAWKAIRVLQYPRLLEAYEPGALGFPEPMDLTGRKLQVIVKLANILLVGCTLFRHSPAFLTCCLDSRKARLRGWVMACRRHEK